MRVPAPSQPHIPKFLFVAVFYVALELDLRRFFRRRRRARLGVISRELTMCSWNYTHRALGIVSPTVRIGIFFTDVTDTRDLIFQARAVTLVND